MKNALTFLDTGAVAVDAESRSRLRSLPALVGAAASVVLFHLVLEVDGWMRHLRSGTTRRDELLGG